MNTARRLACAFMVLASSVAVAGPEAILGEWRGTSLCTDRQLAPACNDEQVHLIFFQGPDVHVMHLDARKLVGAAYETMFEIDLTYASASDAWVHAFEARGRKGRWSFRVAGDALDGALVDQATGSPIRKVTASAFKPAAAGR